MFTPNHINNSFKCQLSKPSNRMADIDKIDKIKKQYKFSIRNTLNINT